MPERPGLSKAEMEVAGVVWRLKKATVREVFEAISQKHPIDFFTVQTYLRRLEAKGYFRSRRRGRAMVYSPVVSGKTVIRETLDDLIDRLFDGEAMPLVHHLIEDGMMTTEDIQQLRELLGRLEDHRDGDSGS